MGEWAKHIPLKHRLPAAMRQAAAHSSHMGPAGRWKLSTTSDSVTGSSGREAFGSPQPRLNSQSSVKCQIDLITDTCIILSQGGKGGPLGYAAVQGAGIETNIACQWLGDDTVLACTNCRETKTQKFMIADCQIISLLLSQTHTMTYFSLTALHWGSVQNQLNHKGFFLYFLLVKLGICGFKKCRTSSSSHYNSSHAWSLCSCFSIWKWTKSWAKFMLLFWAPILQDCWYWIGMLS